MVGARILFCLAAAAMAGPAAAQEVAAEPALVSPSVRTAPARRARPSLAALHVLPPLRPTFDAAEAAANVASEAPPNASAATAIAETAPGPRVAVLPPARPAFPADPLPPEPTPSLFSALFGPAPAPAAAPDDRLSSGPAGPTSAGRARLDALIAAHAKLNDVPEALVHRVVIRESRYNPRAVGRGGAMGLMQIKTGTARALGYEGNAQGLLDAETNLTYAVKYLAGAYRVAGGNHDGAVRNYAQGYYYAAKRLGMTGSGERRIRTARRGRSKTVASAETEIQAR